MGKIRKTLGILIVLAVVVVAATALVWSYVLPRVTDAAGQLDDVDLTIGSAAVSRAATSQAVIMAVGTANGTATDDALTTALNEAAANLDAYDRLTAELADSGAAVDEAVLAGLSSQGRAVLAALGAGDVDMARATLQDGFESSYGAVIGGLGDVRADVESDLDAVSRWSEGIGFGVRLAVTLAIPILALVVFWWMARQRIVINDRRAEERIAAEKARGREKDQLLAAVTRRFEAPLTNVYGLSDVLIQKKQIKGLERDLVTHINSDSAEVHRVAQDVLAAVDLEAGSLTPAADIISLAEAIDDVVKPFWASGVEIKVECPEVWVVSDGDKVRHILRNLVSNAVKYGGSPIFVEGSEIEGVVQCVVIDHGEGLPAGHWADTDEAGGFVDGFTSADHIGLRVAYSLAELVGARLEHFRVDDQTRFVLSFAEEGDIESRRRTGRRSIIKRIPRPIRRGSAQESETS